MYNFDKTLDASIAQIEDIKLIRKNRKFAKLPENLKETATRFPLVALYVITGSELVEKGFRNANRFYASSIRQQWISLYLRNE